jgi:hypothetical protein
LQNLQAAIKRFFHVSDLGPTDKTPMSATEVMTREAMAARRLAGAYGNLLQEFLFPLVRRVVWLGKRQGAARGLPRLDGQQVKIKPLAPLTRAMAQDNILRHTRFMEIMTAFFGPQMVALTVDQDKFSPWLAEQTGFDPNLLRTQAGKEQLVQAVAQLAQQTGMMPQPGGQ